MLRNIKDELVSRPRYKWETVTTVQECEMVIKENQQVIEQWQSTHSPIVVMCPPTYYDIVDNTSVAGNGFLESGAVKFHEDAKKNKEIMMNDWRSFQTSLTNHGVTLINMEPRQHLPDQVFTADSSQSYTLIKVNRDELQSLQSISIFSNFAHPGRVEETAEIMQLFDSIKLQAKFADVFNQRVLVKAEQKMEGTGDNLIDPYRGIIISGYGHRNSEQSLNELQNYTGIPVYGIKSKEPFFHVDTYLCVLPGGYVLYAPDVMHEEGIKQLETIFFKNHPELKAKYGITMSKEDANNFVCNAVIINNDIIMQPCSDELKEKLTAKGFRITFAPAQIANYAGGGFHCMTNKINQVINYNVSYNLPQAIRNELLDNKKEEEIVEKLKSSYQENEIREIYPKVKTICQQVEKNTNNKFFFWQEKKSLLPNDHHERTQSQKTSANEAIEDTETIKMSCGLAKS